MTNITGITNNYHVTVSETYASNLSSTIVAGAVTVPVNSGSPFSDGDWAVLTVEPGTANQATFYGQKSGNSFISCVWTEGNTSVGHSSGAAIVDYDSATHYALVVKSLSTEHEADGTHGNITPTNVTSNGVSWANLITGWQEANATWTYASATSFVQSGDVRSLYPVGTKLRLVQSASTKYFYVTSTAYTTQTTVNITGGTDYTLANSAISSPFYSYTESPQGFPKFFSYTPTYTNLSGGTTTLGRFTIRGGYCRYWVRYTLAGAGVTGAVEFSLPAAASTNFSANTQIGVAVLADTGTNRFEGLVVGGSSVNVAAIVYSGTNAAHTNLSSTVPHTWANTDIIDVQGEYLLAFS